MNFGVSNISGLQKSLVDAPLGESAWSALSIRLPNLTSKDVTGTCSTGNNPLEACASTRPSIAALSTMSVHVPSSLTAVIWLVAYLRTITSWTCIDDSSRVCSIVRCELYYKRNNKTIFFSSSLVYRSQSVIETLIVPIGHNFKIFIIFDLSQCRIGFKKACVTEISVLEFLQLHQVLCVSNYITLLL